MDELRIIFIKISIWIILVDLILVLGAFIAFKISKNNKTKGVLRIIGWLLIVVFIWEASELVKDNIDFSPQITTVKVIEKDIEMEA